MASNINIYHAQANKLVMKGRKNWTKQDKKDFDFLFQFIDYETQELIKIWEFESPVFHLSKDGI